MNQFTIEFKNSKDLAKKIAEYNNLMNPSVVEQESPKPAKAETKKQTRVIPEYELEPDAAEVEPEAVEYETAEVENETETMDIETSESESINESAEESADPVAAGEVEPEIEEDHTPVEETSEAPITDFDGNPVEPETIEIEPVEEVAKPVDKKAYWATVKEWMGDDASKAGKVVSTFNAHGVQTYNSASLTDEIIKDLDAVINSK